VDLELQLQTLQHKASMLVLMEFKEVQDFLDLNRTIFRIIKMLMLLMVEHKDLTMVKVPVEHLTQSVIRNFIM
jgi:hypothetical protein